VPCPCNLDFQRYYEVPQLQFTQAPFSQGAAFVLCAGLFLEALDIGEAKDDSARAHSKDGQAASGTPAAKGHWCNTQALGGLFSCQVNRWERLPFLAGFLGGLSIGCVCVRWCAHSTPNIASCFEQKTYLTEK
jgi:hypothetical protein